MRRKPLFPHSPKKTTIKAGHLALWALTVFPIHCVDLQFMTIMTTRDITSPIFSRSINENIWP